MKIYSVSTSKTNAIFLKLLFLIREMTVVLFLNQIITKEISKKTDNTFLNAIEPGMLNTNINKLKTPKIRLLINLNC